MTDFNHLSKDVSELLSRITRNNTILENSGSESTLETTIVIIPTLAERKFTEKAKLILESVVKKLDSENFWQNVYFLEAVSAMCLRGIESEDSEERIRNSVEQVIKLSKNKELEYILRAARSIVIAGLALKDSEVVENGLIQARSAVENGNEWSENYDKALNGLLALADLYKISNDEATYSIIQERLQTLDVNSASLIKKTTEPDLLARSGVILEKLGEIDEAGLIYSHLVKAFSPDELSSSALKFRIELGARLFGELEKKNVEFESNDAPVNVKVETEEKYTQVELPAEKAGRFEQPLISAVVIQEDSPEGVTESVSALLGQSVIPDEMVIVWTDKGRNLNLPDYNGSLVQITTEKKTFSSTTWKLGIAASTGKWLWMLRAGTKPESDVLEKIVPFRSDEDIDAIHLSKSKGDLKPILDSLSISPALESERVLVKKETFSGISSDVRVRSYAFWAMSIEKLKDAVWKEVIYKTGDPFISNQHEQDRYLLGDSSEIYRNFKATCPEDRKARQLFIDKTRTSFYDFLKNKSIPLVSIIIDTMGEKASDLKTLESVLANTSSIPFEVITSTTREHSENFIDSINELGIMNVRVENSEMLAENRNKAALEAKGEYLVFVSDGILVQENWLNHLIQPLENDHSIGIAGGLVYTNAGTILHAGVAFSGNSNPHRIHYGGSILQGATQKERRFQAIDDDFLMIRRELFEKLEGFDTCFDSPLFSYDFCLTARCTGVGVTFIPKSRALKAVVSEIITNDEWDNKWGGRIEEDLHVYAKLDGYDLEEHENNLKMKPKGKQIPVKSVPEVENQGNPIDRAKIIHKQPENSEKEFVQLLVKAESHLKDGSYDKAEHTLNMARSQVNGNVSNRVQYWTLLGDARFRLEKPDEAYKCYRKAIDDDPDAQRAWIGIGTYHLIQGELEKAEEIFDKVITKNPDNLRGYLGKGNVKLQKQLPQDALHSFQKAAVLDPGYRPTIVGLVAAALQAEKMQEALPSLEKYLEIHTDDMEARFHLAAIYYGTSRLDSALEEASKVLDANPDHQGAKELMIHLKESAEE